MHGLWLGRKGLANELLGELWPKADIVPLEKETMNEDGTNKVKLRLIALLETPVKLIESIAVDLAADHLVTLMHTRQVGSERRPTR